MRIKLNTPQLIGDRTLHAGSVVELGEKRAKELIASKHATKTDDELGEPTAEPEVAPVEESEPVDEPTNDDKPPTAPKTKKK